MLRRGRGAGIGLGTPGGRNDRVLLRIKRRRHRGDAVRRAGVTRLLLGRRRWRVGLLRLLVLIGYELRLLMNVDAARSHGLSRDVVPVVHVQQIRFFGHRVPGLSVLRLRRSIPRSLSVPAFVAAFRVLAFIVYKVQKGIRVVGDEKASKATHIPER
jgi:hypothetical protein